MRKLAFLSSLLMIFAIPWENLITITGVGTIGKVSGLLLFGVWLMMVAFGNKVRKPHLFHWLVLLFVLWSVLSIFWSVNPIDTLNSLMTYIQLLVMVYILWDLYTETVELRAGLQAYVLGAYVSIADLLNSYAESGPENYERMSATGFNPNGLATILVLGMPLAWHLAISGDGSIRSRLFQLLNYGYIPCAFFAISLTASRSAFFSTFVVGLYVLWSLRRQNTSFLLLALTTLIGSLFILISSIPEPAIQRLAGTGAEITTGDLNYRSIIWLEATTVFSDHPILGVGLGAYKTAGVETGKSVHNFVLSLLAEVGIVGFGLFAAVLGITVYHAVCQPNSNLSRLWLTVLFVWFLSAATHNLESKKQTWLLFSLVIISAGLHDRRIDSTVRPDSLRTLGRSRSG